MRTEATNGDVIKRFQDPAIWTDVPTALLQAEIAPRADTPTKPACGSGHSTKAYNTPLHFFALLLILGLSVGGGSLFESIREAFILTST
ncbi:MAG: hypothetical protein Q9210_007244 [Variospora velana]